MTFLAVRYLLARRKQTLLTLLGIFLGTAAYISISGVLLGFRVFLVDQLVNNSAHVHIQAREEFLEDHSLDQSFFGAGIRHIFWELPPSGRKDSAVIDNPQNWYRRLQSDPRVAVYTPQLTASVIFSNGRATAPSTITGCDPIQQQRVTTIGENMTEGRFEDLAAGGNRVVIGDELKKRLGVRLLQTIRVATATDVPRPFKVVGVFKTGNKLADSVAYGALADIQAVNHTPNQVNEIAVRLHDYTQAAALANTWASLGVEKVESWDQQNASFFDVFRIQDAVRYLTIGCILIVAGFGIYNVLNMTVMQKRKDIAILRSLGYGTGDIVILFFSQGLILGVSGAVWGLLFGYLISLYLETVSFGGGPLGVGVGHLVISRDIAIYVQAGVLAILASSIASILPARSAGKLTPIDIIRAGAD